MEHKHIANFSPAERLVYLERELACYYAGVAVFLEECFEPGAGVRALGITPRSDYVKLAAEVDVKATDIGRMLPVWSSYAYEGVVQRGYDLETMNAFGGGPLERLRDMLHMLRTDDPYFQLCLEAVEYEVPDEVEFGVLADLCERTTARHNLDKGSRMSAPELALLANMSERSVRNAMLVGGDLKAEADGYVSNAEAQRWLQGRRGFVPTTRLEFPADIGATPESLGAAEIPPFVRRRLVALGKAAKVQGTEHSRYPQWVQVAVDASGLDAERILAGCDLPLDVRPQDCQAWAKALKVDAVWFTHQVMAALFPDQVDMLLNPGAWRAPEMGSKSGAGSAVTVTLTPAMLQHGYLDLPASASRLFPADCMGGREEGSEGSQVEFVYGAMSAQTDIRVKSAKTISPRKRFGAWFKDELNARAGDRIRVEKTGERQYRLTHLAG